MAVRKKEKQVSDKQKGFPGAQFLKRGTVVLWEMLSTIFTQINILMLHREANPDLEK